MEKVKSRTPRTRFTVTNSGGTVLTIEPLTHIEGLPDCISVGITGSVGAFTRDEVIQVSNALYNAALALDPQTPIQFSSASTDIDLGEELHTDPAAAQTWMEGFKPQQVYRRMTPKQREVVETDYPGALFAMFPDGTLLACKPNDLPAVVEKDGYGSSLSWYLKRELVRS